MRSVARERITNAMCDAHMPLDGLKRPQDRRSALVRPSGLDNAEIVITAKCARPAAILAAIAADPERAAALALARSYTDASFQGWPIAFAPRYGFWRARHYYRVALGLEAMDTTTGEA